MDVDWYADGIRDCDESFRTVGGEGVSANMMLGPGPSSVATRVMGTGFDENFGVDV